MNAGRPWTALIGWLLFTATAAGQEPRAAESDLAALSSIFLPGESRRIATAFPPDASRSRQRWTISSITHGCACLAIDAGDAFDFDASGATPIALTFTAGTTLGTMRSAAAIRCLDSAGRGHDLGVSITAQIRDYIAWPSTDAVLDLGHPGADGTWSLLIRRGSHPDRWRQLSLGRETPDGPLEVRCDAEDEHGILVHVALADPHLRGTLMQPVTAHFLAADGTALAYAAERRLRVQAGADVAASPSAMLFGIVAPGQTVERSVVIERPAGGPEVTAVHLPDDRFSSPAPTGADQRGGIVVRFTADDSGRTWPGAIDVALSDGTTLRIACLGRVVARAKEVPGR